MAEDPESVALLAEEAEQRPRPGCNRLVTLLPVVALLSLAFFFTPHTKSLRGNEAGAVQLSLLLFEPVDGGIERACRGADQNDNNPSHFVVTSASDLASCQLLCLEYGGCQGVEFHSGNGRCELWIRPDGIQASRSFSPAECYRRVGILEPVDGGVDRACRGGSTSDNNPSNYEIREAQSFEDCQRECLIAAECRGIEFSAGRCEIWTRPEGIQASISLSGFQCYRATSTANTETTTATSTLTSLTTVTATSLTTSATATSVTASATTSATSILATTPSPDAISFRGVDGGIDRVCRGANENDNDPSHFEVFDVDDLEACKDLCRVTTACVGIESIGRRCEIWTRLDGIQASREVAGYQCLEAVMFAPVDGGQNRACRENAPGDNLPEYYQIATAFSMEDCQQQCEANSTTCTGVEFSGNRCEIWNRAIWTSIALDGFQCFRYVSRVQMTFLTEVLASTWDITGGVDVECRGADPEDDSPGYYSLVEASSLQRCQDRCLALTICKGIEYRRGHCELWTRPGGIQATKPLADSVCLQRPGSSPPGAVQTKYVAHYMPWFLGFDNGYDHFCQGNAHYESYLGVYDLNNRDIIRQQLDLMKNSSIDGLWIDYQLASWNDVIDVIMEETAIRGMGVAIVMDSVTNPNIFIDAAQKMVEWTSLSHYYRHNGIPVVPIFQTPDINFQAFPFEAYYMVRRESNPPAWANGSYPWVTPSLNSLDLYYQQDHSLSSFAIGAAFRGFRDCYSDRTLITPFLQMMGPTLDLASKFQPEFVQVITWNDYSEGTMIEPSWVCPRNLCLSACAQNVQNCLTTAACDSGFDPLDCSKPYGNFSGPVDPQCNSNAIASADDDLRLLAEHIRAEAEGTLQLDYGALSTFTGLVTETEGWYYRTSEEIMMVK